MKYSVVVGNDALRLYRPAVRGLSLEEATTRAREYMPHPNRTRRFAFVAVIPDGYGLSAAVLTIRGEM